MNGDLVCVNFVGDYNFKVLCNEMINGENYVVMELIVVDWMVIY